MSENLVVTKLLSEEMKKERVRMCEVLVATNATVLLLGRPGVKSELASLTLTQETS